MRSLIAWSDLDSAFERFRCQLVFARLTECVAAKAKQVGVARSGFECLIE